MRTQDQVEGMIVALRERIRSRSKQMGREPLTAAIEYLADANHDDRMKIDTLNWLLEINPTL